MGHLLVFLLILSGSLVCKKVPQICEGTFVNPVCERCVCTFIKYINVTLLLEKQQKEFTSNKPIYPLQFGTIIHIMGLSLTFKTIK